MTYFCFNSHLYSKIKDDLATSGRSTNQFIIFPALCYCLIYFRTNVSDDVLKQCVCVFLHNHNTHIKLYQDNVCTYLLAPLTKHRSKTVNMDLYWNASRIKKFRSKISLQGQVIIIRIQYFLQVCTQIVSVNIYSQDTFSPEYTFNEYATRKGGVYANEPISHSRSDLLMFLRGCWLHAQINMDEKSGIKFAEVLFLRANSGFSNEVCLELIERFLK